jgi:hypothetical protein
MRSMAEVVKGERVRQRRQLAGGLESRGDQRAIARKSLWELEFMRLSGDPIRARKNLVAIGRFDARWKQSSLGSSPVSRDRRS